MNRIQARLYPILYHLSVWLFWPGLVLVTWGELQPSGPDVETFILFIIPTDKAMHFTAYFGLAAMAAMVLGTAKFRFSPKLAAAIAGVVLYGGLMEIIQGYFGRDASWWDFLANVIGVICGIGTAFFILRRTERLVAAGPKR